MKILNDSGGAWKITSSALPATPKMRRGRTASAPSAPMLPGVFLLPGVSIALVQDATPRIRRGAKVSPLEFRVDCAPEERAVVAVRHPSGALTFHPPVDEERKRRSGSQVIRFSVELAEAEPVRRGLISKGVKLIVVKIRKALIDEAVKLGLRKASRAAESAWWKSRRLSEGWCRLDAADGTLVLQHLNRVESGAQPALLFLHGTFSDTAGSYCKLMKPGVFAELRARYGHRVFSFEHFSVSRSLAENVRMMLKALPDRETVFDVVAYSRGGLVLRMLAEQPERFGALSNRFRLNHGVLVAVPNAGTPLASHSRFEDTFGLVANLLEWLPDNPWTSGAEFVANGIVWLAGRVTGDLPGLAAMDSEGETIASLQDGRGPVSGHYSAIGANYDPGTSLWKRLLDAGVDGFFAGANDLVVPTDGAWQVDPGERPVVQADRVACFGFDGNINPNNDTVHHLNVLAQAETARFIRRALTGSPQELGTIDLSRLRKSRRPWRGATEFTPTVATASAWRTPLTSDRARREVRGSPVPPSAGPAPQRRRESDRTLHLMILGDPGSNEKAQILAMYGGARVVENFAFRNLKDTGGKLLSAAGTKFRRIIEFHKRIRMNLDSEVDRGKGEVPTLPTDEEMRDFGTLLFDVLFVGQVRRLYDVARSEQSREPLNVVFTCTIPWVASKPWEFAFDPARRKFLATEEVHFNRNVLTSVPTQRIDEKRPRLRLLMVEAQPISTAELAVEDEEALIRYRFEPLIESGLVEIEVLAEATPDLLHDRVFASWLKRRPYDIVHFIGHGEFDREADEGRLLFVSRDGGAQPVNVQTLREILCGREIKVVFLNACDTGRDAPRTLNRGLAQALVQGGLPAVVANQYKVLDPSAVAFAQHFYWALGHGASLGQAAREARIAVNYSIDGDVIDWAVPVIYARDPDHRLCERIDRTTPLKRARRAVPRSSRSRKAGIERPNSVGVADLARFFPGLSAMVVRLNDVQDQFEFREVEVTTPIGVFERNQEEGRNFLNAERFAEKLRHKPNALGVHILSCITHWWMCDDDTLNIYGWWSSRKDLSVLVFSTAGLALPAEGAEAGRALANGLVAGLAAQMIESQSKLEMIHDRTPSSCPFYYNEDRDIQSVTGRLRFDTRCRKRLKAKLPRKTVSAFEELLGAYDAELGDRPAKVG